MTRDEAVDIIMQRAGRRQDTSLRDLIISEMVLVQETTLEGGDFRPLWLISEVATAYTDIGDERLEIPNDFLEEWEEGALYVYDATNTDDPWIDLCKDDWDVIKDKYPGSGMPKMYDRAGDYFLLAYTPDAQYQIKMRYYARATSLAGTYGDAANIENKWLKWAPDWVIAETLFVIATEYLQNPKLAEVALAQAGRAKKRVEHRDVGARESNKDRFMGDAP